MKPASFGKRQQFAAVLRALLPLLLTGQRSAAGVGAYFDLITDAGRKFYGDSFHFGFFRAGVDDFAAALDAHTDLVAEMAHLAPGMRVLDVGCGVGAPALHMARRHGCQVVGINISAEQVRQGRAMIRTAGASDCVTIQQADARTIDFPDESFDAVVCLESAGDVCVDAADKPRLAAELYRVLRPGGYLGFSDLVLHTCPTRSEDRALRLVLYHTGSELVTDWPAVLGRQGFQIVEQLDILPQVLATWEHARGARDRRQSLRSYGRYRQWVADRTQARLVRIAPVLARNGAFPVLSAQKPPICVPAELSACTEALATSAAEADSA